jgi:hypothetical protein
LSALAKISTLYIRETYPNKGLKIGDSFGILTYNDE